MSPGSALVMGALAAWGTLLATVRVRRPAELGFVWMMISWLVGELAVVHLVAQAVGVTLFVHDGVLHDTTGIVGVALFGMSMVGLVAVQWRATTAAAAFDRALATAFGPHVGRPAPPPAWHAWLPFRVSHRGVEVLRNLQYGDPGKRNRFDVYRATGTGPGSALPVVVYVHGGGWVIGNKDQQGKPMLVHLARSGYLGVSINYRLAPRNRWPAQIVDVKRAVVWVREHIAQYGGDPAFIAVSGSSAGGHLAALAALTPGDPAFQPGFERADASVDACVAIYAPFDLTDSAGLRHRAALRRFLEPLVMPSKLRDDEAGWRAASPLWRVSAQAPPFLVIQGGLDTLVWREEAREFATVLGACSAQPLAFVQVPGAQHAFEVFNSVRCRAAVDAIVCFLHAVRDDSAGGESHR